MTPDREALLGRLARLVAAGDQRQPFAVRLCDAGRVLVGGRSSSISISNGARVTIAATDDLAVRLEDLQDALGEGPSRAAYRENQPVATDLRDTAHWLWPEFSRSARELAGAVTMHCYPMRPAGQLLGVFSVYAFDGLAESTETVQFLADAVGAAVHPNEFSALRPGPTCMRDGCTRPVASSQALTISSTGDLIHERVCGEHIDT